MSAAGKYGTEDTSPLVGRNACHEAMCPEVATPDCITECGPLTAPKTTQIPNSCANATWYGTCASTDYGETLLLL